MDPNIITLFSTIEALVNRINKLELIISYSNLKNNISPELFNEIINNNENNNNLPLNTKEFNTWIEIKEDIPLLHKPEEILRINRGGQINDDEIIKEKEDPRYKEYQFISPEIFIENLYNKLEKPHNEKIEMFKTAEKERVKRIIEKNNNDYKLMREHIEKREAHIEEAEYQKALRQAKIEARIQAQKKLLFQEALQELKTDDATK